MLVSSIIIVRRYMNKRLFQIAPIFENVFQESSSFPVEYHLPGETALTPKNLNLFLKDTRDQ